MANFVIESFGWCNTVATLVTRYGGLGAVGAISVGGGRFGGNAFQVFNNQFQSFIINNGPIGSTVRIGFASQDPWTPSAANQGFCYLLDSAGLVQVYLRVNASRQVELRNGSHTVLATGVTTLQGNSWYYFELLVTVDSAAGSASCQVDGVAQFSVAAVNTRGPAAASCGRWAFQQHTGGGTQSFCDLFISDAGPLGGERRVALLVPTADGAASAWTPSTGTALWSLVDEIPPNGDTDYISSVTAGQQALFAFSNLPYTPAVIDGVLVSIYARKDDAGTREIAALVRSGGTTVTGATQAISSTYLDIYGEIWDQNPVSVAPWTGADVDAIEAGVECIT